MLETGVASSSCRPHSHASCATAACSVALKTQHLHPQTSAARSSCKCITCSHSQAIPVQHVCPSQPVVHQASLLHQQPLQLHPSDLQGGCAGHILRRPRWQQAWQLQQHFTRSFREADWAAACVCAVSHFTRYTANMPADFLRPAPLVITFLSHI